jgi:hypothetical protein
LQGIHQALARLGAVAGRKEHQLGRVLRDGARGVFLRDHVVEGDRRVVDRIVVAGQGLPIGVRQACWFGNRETFLRQRRGVVAGLRIGTRSTGVESLAALGLLHIDRGEDGLRVVGIDLKQTGRRAQQIVHLVGLAVAIHHLGECGRLGGALRIGLEKTIERRTLLRRIILGGGVLIAVELGRILNLDGLAVSLKCGRGNQAHACQCHRRCKD